MHHDPVLRLLIAVVVVWMGWVVGCFYFFFTPQGGEGRAFSYYVEIQQKECERRGKEKGLDYSDINEGG